MLDAHAHGKGFTLHSNALRMEHGKGIPGAVADGQHHMVAGDLLALIGHHGADLTVFAADIRHAGVKADFATQGNDPIAQILHHVQQHIRTYMGLCIEENILICAKFYKFLQNPADARIIHTGVQLTIRECAGTALSKLDIALGIQVSGTPEGLHFIMAALGILAPFQNDGLQAGQRQHQGSKHAARAKANHHRTHLGLGLGFRQAVERHRRNGSPLAAGLLQDLIFIAIHRHIHGINHLHIRLFPGIDGSADDLHLADLGIGDF